MSHSPSSGAYGDSVITVTRQGHPGFECAVVVEQEIYCVQEPTRWHVNPQREVLLAMQGRTTLSRNGCIVSFAEGLVAAGHMVILRERRQKMNRRDYPFHTSNWISYEYFLFGLAWGKATWEQIRSQLLMTIVPERRLAVLTATGQYYHTRQREPLTLRMPIV